MNDKTEPLSTVAVDPLVSEFSENDCLACGPFDGDFGSPDDRILKDKMVTARKGGECFLCEQEILPGERIRVMAAVFDCELMSYRWCNACCAAMAKMWLDDGEPYDFDYVAEQTVASGGTEDELLASALEYKRLCGMPLRDCAARRLGL